MLQPLPTGVTQPPIPASFTDPPLCIFHEKKILKIIKGSRLELFILFTQIPIVSLDPYLKRILTDLLLRDMKLRDWDNTLYID